MQGGVAVTTNNYFKRQGEIFLFDSDDPTSIEAAYSDAEALDKGNDPIAAFRPFTRAHRSHGCDLVGFRSAQALRTLPLAAPARAMLSEIEHVLQDAWRTGSTHDSKSTFARSNAGIYMSHEEAAERWEFALVEARKARDEERKKAFS